MTFAWKMNRVSNLKQKITDKQYNCKKTITKTNYRKLWPKKLATASTDRNKHIFSAINKNPLFFCVSQQTDTTVVSHFFATLIFHSNWYECCASDSPLVFPCGHCVPSIYASLLSARHPFACAVRISVLIVWTANPLACAERAAKRMNATICFDLSESMHKIVGFQSHGRCSVLSAQ